MKIISLVYLMIILTEKKETYRRWRAEGIWNPKLYRNLKYHDVDVTFDNQFTNPPDIELSFGSSS